MYLFLFPHVENIFINHDFHRINLYLIPCIQLQVLKVSFWLIQSSLSIRFSNTERRDLYIRKKCPITSGVMNFENEGGSVSCLSRIKAMKNIPEFCLDRDFAIILLYSNNNRR